MFWAMQEQEVILIRSLGNFLFVPTPQDKPRRQSRVTAIAESSLAGMALMPAGGRGHAEKSPSTRAQRARSCPGRESAGILGILCVSQESAGICVNKHELDSHLLPVTKKRLTARSQYLNSNGFSDQTPEARSLKLHQDN